MDCSDVEVDELTDNELAEGDNRLEFRGGKAAALSDIDLPLPSTLPSPGFLDDIFPCSLAEE